MKVIRPVLVTGNILAGSSVVEADHPEWSAGTTYALGDRVIKAATHRIYESVIADNIGHDPAAVPDTSWLDAGPTNRWAMFDPAGGPSTVAAGQVAVELVPADPVSSLGLVDVSAGEARVRVEVAGVAIYDVTQAADTNLTYLDLPAVAGQRIFVTLTAPGGADVSVGKLVIGDAVDLGETEEKPTVSITDFSRRETDDFGVTTVVRRGWSRRISTRARIDSDDVDRVQRYLADIRAVPALWIGDEDFEALTVYGFYKDFSIDLVLGTATLCSLSVEGLPSADVAVDHSDPAVQGESDLLVIPPLVITDAVLTASNVLENDYAPWVANITYQAGDRVVWPATHRIYESLVPGNTGKVPSTVSAWLDIGPTNRWSMFDQALGTATEQATSIIVTLTPSAPVTALAVLDSNAASVRVQSGAYDQIRNVQPADQGGSISFLDLDVASGNAITVTISAGAAGDLVSVGTLLLGASIPLGVTENAPTIGIDDYSRKEADDFGNTLPVERAWAKRMSVRSLVRSDAVDGLVRTMAALRATPALWIGNAAFDSLTIYGFYRDFSAELSEATGLCSFQIEGLSKAPKIVEADDPIILVTVYQNAAEKPATPAFGVGQVPPGWTVAPQDLPKGQYRWSTQAEFRGPQQRTAWTTPVVVAGVNWADLNRGVWAPGVAYEVGEFFQHEGSTYIVIKAHVSSASLPPPNEFVALLAAAGNPGAPGDAGDPGPPGPDAVSAALTSSARSVWAYANGVVKEYSGITTTVVIRQGTVDVSANFIVVIASNPNALQVTLSGRTATVVGAGTATGEFGNTAVLAATLTLRATGTGAFAGMAFDLVFALGKMPGGYEIVTTLPTTDNFVGRLVVLSANGKLYRYTANGWTSAVEAGDITGGINATQFADGIEPVTIITVGALPTVKTTSAIVYGGKLYRWNGTAYVTTVDANDLAADSVTSAKIAAGAVNTRELAAGAVSTEKLVVQTSGNLLFGAQPGAPPSMCWRVGWQPGGVVLDEASGWPITSPAVGGNFPDPATWSTPDYGTMAVHQINETPSGVFACTDVYFRIIRDLAGTGSDYITVTPNAYYEFSCYVGSHRCQTDMFIQWLDANYQNISLSNNGADSQSPADFSFPGGNWIGRYKRNFVRGQAPPTATFAQVILRKYTTAPGGLDSWMFFVYPQFAKCVPNATQLMDYVQPASTIISGQGLLTQSVTTDSLRAGSVTAAKMAVTELSAITSRIGLLRTADTGQRMELDSNNLRSYYGNNALAGRMGIW